MTAIMFLNVPAALRSILDALVSAWMRQTAAAAEYARPRHPSHRSSA
jgi:hypothetical protein